MSRRVNMVNSLFIWVVFVVGAALMAQAVKNLPAMQETRVQALGQEDPLEKEMVTHSRCLVAKLCLDLCSPKDCSLPGSSVHEIFQARILEWVAISFSRRSSKPRDQTHIFCVGKGVIYCWTNMETSFIWVDNFN